MLSVDELNPKQNAATQSRGKLGTKIQGSIFDPNNEEQIVATPGGYGTLPRAQGHSVGRVDESSIKPQQYFESAIESEEATPNHYFANSPSKLEHTKGLLPLQLI